MKDSQKLDLYRQHIDTFRQWLGHEFPVVDHVLATLKETVDGGSLNAGTPRDMEFCTINGLRDQLRRQAARATAEQRDSVIEEWIEETCAAYCIPKPLAIIDAIRALKSQQDAAIESQRSEKSNG